LLTYYSHEQYSIKAYLYNLFPKWVIFFSVRYTSKFGFRLGTGFWNYGLVEEVKLLDTLSILALYTPQDFPIATLLYSQRRYPFKETKSNFENLGIDYGLEYHFTPKSQFDLYLVGMMGIGTCSQSCSAYRLSLGSGLRINWVENFIYFESNYEKPFLYDSGIHFYPNIDSINFKFGFGLNKDILASILKP
jgi:hypothetical protein